MNWIVTTTPRDISFWGFSRSTASQAGEKVRIAVELPFRSASTLLIFFTGFTACGKIRFRAALYQGTTSVVPISPSFLMFRADFSPRRTRLSDFFSSLFSSLLLIWLLQQAPIGSVEGCPDRRFRRRYANFKPTSPAKRPASSTWRLVAGPMVSSVLDADIGEPTNW